jgi:hypothetical protein
MVTEIDTIGVDHWYNVEIVEIEYLGGSNEGCDERLNGEIGESLAGVDAR